MLPVPSASSISAQTIEGHLLELGTHRPIPGGLVALIDEESIVIDRVEADSLGRFMLRSPEPGSFFVRAQGLGYQMKTDGILELGDGGRITIEFYLRPQPIEIEGITATTDRRDPIEVRQRVLLEREGFYDRVQYGFGHFITPEALEKRPPWTPRDLFRAIPGVDVDSSSFMQGQQAVRLSRCRRSFSVWMDGTQVWSGRVWPIEQFVDVNEIAAVEVYTRASSVPLRYNVAGSSCGVILIWTKS